MAGGGWQRRTFACPLGSLANDVPDPAGLLIPEVCRLLPEVIRDRIDSEFANWEDFTKAIKAISKSSIDDALEKTKTLHRTIDEL
jgi:hypothetical protein